MEKIDVLVITDSYGSSQEERTLDSLLARIADSDINWQHHSIKVLTLEECAGMTLASKGNISQDLFLERYREVQHVLDVNQIATYAIQRNHRLHASLKKPSSEPETALWKAFSHSMRGNAWDGDLNYFGVIVDEAEKVGYPNVLEVLFHHRVVAVDFGQVNNIPYHHLGQGFVAEGTRWPMYDAHNNRIQSTAILIPMSLVKQFSLNRQIAYGRALLTHEIIGHSKLGLKDHSYQEVNPQNCMMSIPPTRKAFVELAVQNLGVYLCSRCLAKQES